MRPSLLLLFALAVLVPAQTARAQALPAPVDSATVTGTVYDSLSRAPLHGATVQLVDRRDPAGFSRSATTDSGGRYRLTGIPPGRYVIGFLHPVLDSLGISAPLRELSVQGRRHSLDLAVPSPQRLSVAACGIASPGDSVAAVVGIVRDAASGTAVPGAVVQAEWLDLSFGAGGLQRSIRRRQATTPGSGWFALCDVPRGGAMQLMASRDTDSTDAIELEIPRVGFLRRDLYLGRSRVLGAGTVSGDTATTPAAPRREGDGRLRGIVLEAEGSRPLQGADVSIPGGPGTLSNARGEWLLNDVPMGTRTLEVRAIGFYPHRRGVDVVADAPPIRTALLTMRAVLDTVRVVANRNRLEGTGFDERRRSGMGRYITSEEIARRLTLNTSDLFRTVPGVRVDRQTLGDTFVTVSGLFGRCTPSIYIDGHMMLGLSADEIDAFVHPDDVAGVEVYTGVMVPPQFQPALTGCGSIVIWTSPSVEPRVRWSIRRRLAHGVSAILLGVGIGALLGRL